MSSKYQKAYFLLSAADVKQLPPDEGIEVAIVGRSNSGKSSVLNRITHHKGLARVSKTPGRTQLLNVFVLDDTRRLIDLPGYGFAKAAPTAKRIWQKAIDAYFQGRESLKGVILIMDIRHPLKDSDWHMLEYCSERALPVHILLNKSDKLSNSAVADTVREVKNELSEPSSPVTVQPFSALKNIGIKELEAVLNEWYQ
jgi:GTP-binding protein